MNRNKHFSNLQNFKDLVQIKYELYNGLFLTLPFQGLKAAGVELSFFSKYCREQMDKKKSPLDVIEDYFKERYKGIKEEEKSNLLFKFLQFIERQIVLFDALEESSFESIEDIHGSGTLNQLFEKVTESSRISEMIKLLETFKIRIVLTAHPTQFYPQAILGIINDLSDAIKSNEIKQINYLLLQLGKTRFTNKKKPTPLTEASNIIWFLWNIFYHVFADIYRELDSFYRENTGKELENPIFELGFWPGGDRDGNPYVTSKTTTEVSKMLKRSILRNYREDVEFLTKRLTFDGVLEKIMAIAEKLKLTREASIINEAKKGQYSSKEELLDDLYIIREQLIDQHESLFLNELNDFIYKVKLFGFHFASIDLRQDSRVHSTILSEFLENYPNLNVSKKENYLKLDFEKRKDFLTKFLQSSPSIKSLNINKFSEISRDCFDYISKIDNIQNTNGLDSLHRYIISNTQHEVNIMELYVLLMLTIRKAEDIKVDLVPLFETINDLENSISVMDALYNHPVYKKHLHLRKNKQYIMLGFSDGTKDGGYITANWSIYQAKEKLSEISEKHGINVVFFDGRGGPPARGGGNTRNYYLGQGEKIHQSEIQLTIQGQTISSKFGRNENCRFNLENLLTAGLENKLFPDLENEIEGKNRLLINELSNKSFEIYSKFKNHPLFLSYLEERTPLRYFSKLNIASRPVKRKGNQSLRFEDLRAIPFVASWAQVKHNIPGYYGVGSSINQLIKAGKLKDLQKFYQESRFFRTLLGNSMQSLEKTNMSLTAYMKKDRKYGKFWEIMKKEVELSIESLKQVSHQNELLANLPVTKVSVKMRERIVFPLLVIQQWAFLKLAKKGKKNKAGKQEIVLEKLIIKALAGNVNASRNSA